MKVTAACSGDEGEESRRGAERLSECVHENRGPAPEARHVVTTEAAGVRRTGSPRGKKRGRFDKESRGVGRLRALRGSTLERYWGTCEEGGRTSLAAYAASPPLGR